uniref:tRNA-specific 2-thiouridylase MnmA-like C-terminal domain-containing protein n=1 Tax=Parascaris equorum TaxID=6256 RepID=A0A914R5K7_PAREQ
MRLLFQCEGSLHPLLFATEFVVSEPEWIAESPLMKSESVLVDFRCQRTHPAFECILSRLENGFLKVVPRNPIRAAAPGQTCVFYLSDECLGSGRIENVTATLAHR